VKKQYSKRFITVRPEVMKGNGTLILNILLGLTLFIKNITVLLIQSKTEIDINSCVYKSTYSN
jgi:hypothetical protein